MNKSTILTFRVACLGFPEPEESTTPWRRLCYITTLADPCLTVLRNYGCKKYQAQLFLKGRKVWTRRAAVKIVSCTSKVSMSAEKRWRVSRKRNCVGLQFDKPVYFRLTMKARRILRPGILVRNVDDSDDCAREQECYSNWCHSLTEQSRGQRRWEQKCKFQRLINYSGNLHEMIA